MSQSDRNFHLKAHICLFFQNEGQVESIFCSDWQHVKDAVRKKCKH